jgi:hypothetical protein
MSGYTAGGEEPRTRRSLSGNELNLPKAVVIGLAPIQS